MSNDTPWPPPPPPDDLVGVPTFDSSQSTPVDNSRLAGFWLRFVAHLIDSITIGLVDLPFRLVADNLDRNGNPGLSTMVYFAGVAVSLYAYAYWTGQRGGTPLRAALGVYIVDANNGSFIGTRRGLKRILMSYVSALALLIGYLWMFSNPRKQTWHDIVARTVVIKR